MPKQNSNAVTANGGAKCRWGWLKFGDFRQIARYNSKTSTFASVVIVNLVRSQVYHSERQWALTFVCSTFDVWCMQRVALVCQWQLILVHM